MLRKDYENYKWYPVTDETYYVEDYPDEFPNCITVISSPNENYAKSVLTRNTVYLGWGTMAKQEGDWFFMIIEKPKTGAKC